MRILVLGLAAVLPAASAAAPGPAATDTTAQSGAPIKAPFRTDPMPLLDPNASEPDNCPPISRYHAEQRNPRPEAQRLNELPMADHYKAAYRVIDGCEAPIIAGFGVGNRR